MRVIGGRPMHDLVPDAPFIRRIFNTFNRTILKRLT